MCSGGSNGNQTYQKHSYHLTSLRQRNLDSAKTRSCLSISVNIPKSNNPQINDPAIQEAIRKLKKKKTVNSCELSELSNVWEVWRTTILKIPDRKHFDFDFKSPLIYWEIFSTIIVVTFSTRYKARPSIWRKKWLLNSGKDPDLFPNISRSHTSTESVFRILNGRWYEKKKLFFAEGTRILFRFEGRSLIWRKRITARRVSSSPLSFLVPYCGWPRLTTYFTFKMAATKETRACRRDLFFNIVGF